MSHVVSQRTTFKLSFCIPTFNRAEFIGAALESIVSQATNDCEIVISDNASTDDTERIVAAYATRFENLRYYKQEINKGFDRNVDRAVVLADGEYCWLMSDDDVLRPGAVAAVLKTLCRDYCMVVVNSVVKDSSMSNVLAHRSAHIVSDRVYGAMEMDRLFTDVGFYMTFMSCIVIRRAIWLARDRERYYESIFIHLGVVFQAPLPGETIVIAEPFIDARVNPQSTFMSEISNIVLFKLPSVIWTLAVSESTKRKACSATTWKHLPTLLRWRAAGRYSLAEYRQWIRPRVGSVWERITPILAALTPGVLINALFILYYWMVPVHSGGWPIAMRQSRYYFRNWCAFER